MTDELTLEQLKEKVRVLAGAVADLENRRQFFEVLLRSLPGIFYVFDEKLQVFLWNKNVEEVTGYTEAEISKVNLLSLFTGPDRDTIRKSIRRVFERGEHVTEADILTKDGRRIPYFFTGMSTVIGEKSYLVGVGLDLTHRKAVEGALKESEALYRIFADRMTEGVLLFCGKKILFVNRALVEMCGYEDSPRFMDNEPLDLVTEGFAMYFREMYEALEAGLCQERFFQARWVARGGREFWAEGRANHITWMGRPSILVTCRDITEAKLKEISMQEEAEQLRRENVSLRSSIKDRYRFGDIIGKSPAMQKVYELILNAAATSANVIVYGESGTGKELVARA
ncbi:MAG: PAS domain S-box protein, partial [Pseudomonadota bacterium]